MKLTKLMAIVLVSSMACTALAEESKPEAEAVASTASVLAVGVKGGVALPQLNSSMDTTFFVHLDLVYRLPFWANRVGLITSLGYSQPTASGTEADARLPSGTYDWEMTQRQTTWDLGLSVLFLAWESDFNLGLNVGSRLTFLSTLTAGDSEAAAFGEHDETATLPGVFAGLTAHYRIGPGALNLEIGFASCFEDLHTTGDVAVAEVVILLGYQFAFEF